MYNDKIFTLDELEKVLEITRLKAVKATKLLSPKLDHRRKRYWELQEVIKLKDIINKKKWELVEDIKNIKEQLENKFTIEIFIVNEKDPFSGYSYDHEKSFMTEKEANDFVLEKEKEENVMCFPLFSRKSKDGKLLFVQIPHAMRNGQCDCVKETC